MRLQRKMVWILLLKKLSTKEEQSEDKLLKSHWLGVFWTLFACGLHHQAFLKTNKYNSFKLLIPGKAKLKALPCWYFSSLCLGGGLNPYLIAILVSTVNGIFSLFLSCLFFPCTQNQLSYYLGSLNFTFILTIKKWLGDVWRNCHLQTLSEITYQCWKTGVTILWWSIELVLSWIPLWLCPVLESQFLDQTTSGPYECSRPLANELIIKRINSGFSLKNKVKVC